MADGDVFSLDIATAAPGIGALTYGANNALASHDAHVSVVQGLGAAKPWGNDSIGHAFESNYTQILPDVLEAWRTISHDLSEFAENLQRAQDEAWAANDAATRQWNSP